MYAWWLIVQPDEDNHRTARICSSANNSLMNAVAINRSTEPVQQSNFHNEDDYLPSLNKRLAPDKKAQPWSVMRGAVGF